MPEMGSGHLLPKILLTGAPGCGKTTLLEAVLSKLPLPAGGFLTREVRSNGIRVGFEMTDLHGDTRLLAHGNFPGPPRIGRFGVDLEAVASLAVPAIEQAMDHYALIVVDEIGPMEMASEPFRQVTWKALNGNFKLFGTIVKRSLPQIDRIKNLHGIRIVEVHQGNRDHLESDLLKQLLGEDTENG